MMETDTITVRPDGDRDSANERTSETPFSCNICKKNYTRVDHLARHYRSHTCERPFVCQTCGKSFARIDLLKRHAANHPAEDREPGSESGESVPKRRKTLPSTHRPRAFQACRACAASKLRCEGSQPCYRCKQKSLACEYSQPRASKQPEPSEPPIPGEEITSDNTAPPGLQPERSQMADRRTSAPVNATPDPDPHTVAFQLPTPLTFGHGFDNMATDPMYENDMMLNFDSMPLVDFLRDPHISTGQSGTLQAHGEDDAFPRDVLDFGVDLTLSTPNIFDTDIQFSLDPQLLPPLTDVRESDRAPIRSGLTTPGLRGNLNINASAQAFKESLWLWTPEKDDHGALEQLNLSLPWEGLSPESQPRVDFPVMHQQVTNVVRGKILAMVLRTCESVIYSHVVSNFPSAELLTNLIHNFISFHVRRDMTWIHPGTIEISKESPEFLASMICYGGAISQVPEIRKLGFAIQEAVRVANPIEFERDNRSTRELRPLQSFALHLEVGLWSGNRRKMEISESFALPLLTMVRRAGHYRRTRFHELPPQQEDVGEGLESKWYNWAQRESFKRLALYLFYRDTRSSMSLLTPPLISYAELSAELPCSKELWNARTATEWKTVYLAHQVQEELRPPSIRSCMDDCNRIFESQRVIDIDLSLMLIIATVWPLIWQYREMKSAARFRAQSESRHSTLTMNSRHHEVIQILRHIHMNTTEWLGAMKPVAWLLHEQCLMHMFVSLEDVQLLAGKEGEEEARRVFPILTAWADSSEARQSLFHAGQIIRAAREYPKFHLRDSAAVAVYHASLVFWAYAVLPKSENSSQNQSSGGAGVSLKPVNFIRIDGEEGPALQRFLVLGRGVPCVQRQLEGVDTVIMQEVPLTEPTEVMSVTTKLLQKQHEAGERSCPPLLENLCKLMHALGKAAIGKRHK